MPWNCLFEIFYRGVAERREFAEELFEVARGKSCGKGFDISCLNLDSKDSGIALIISESWKSWNPLNHGSDGGHGEERIQRNPRQQSLNTGMNQFR